MLKHHGGAPLRDRTPDIGHLLESLHGGQPPVDELLTSTGMMPTPPIGGSGGPAPMDTPVTATGVMPMPPVMGRGLQSFGSAPGAAPTTDTTTPGGRSLPPTARGLSQVAHKRGRVY